jgi:hypothetical protein
LKAEAELGTAVRAPAVGGKGVDGFTWLRRCSGRLAATRRAAATEIGCGRNAAAHGRGAVVCGCAAAWGGDNRIRPERRQQREARRRGGRRRCELCGGAVRARMQR